MSFFKVMERVANRLDCGTGRAILFLAELWLYRLPNLSFSGMAD